LHVDDVAWRATSVLSVGMRIAGAKERCPDLVVMPYEFER
jgi:hypothetical protein